MGLHSEINFRNASDTGEPDSAAIIPYVNGEPAHQTTFRRPTENNRSRTDEIRSLLRELIVLSDLDRNGLVLSGGGTVTFNGAKATPPGPYTGEFTLGADLVTMPLATPGGGASTPYLQSTKAWVKAGTPSGADELVFTSKYRQWEDTTTDPDIAKEANKISVEIQGTGSLSVAVDGATGEENNILIGIDFNTTTCQQVIDAVNAHADALKLVVATLGASGVGATVSPKFSEAEWGTDYTTRFLRGGAAGTYHRITNANLAAFWTAEAENPLEKGDTLAIWYDKLVELSTDAGRFQSTPENGIAPTIPPAALFNTRREPEKIPNCIPICKCLDDDTLLFANGARVARTVPATLLLGGSASLDTTGWTRMHASPGAHTPPVTLQQGLNNADDLIEAALTEIEAARNSTVYGAQASIDARIELADVEISDARTSARYGAAASIDARLEALDAVQDAIVVSDGVSSTGGEYSGVTALQDAIAAIAVTGGTVYVKRGTAYTWTTGVVVTAPIRIITEGDRNVTVTCSAAVTVYALTLNGDGSEIRNLTFDGTAATGKGLVVSGNRVTVRNVILNSFESATPVEVSGDYCVFEQLKVLSASNAGIALVVSGASSVFTATYLATRTSPDTGTAGVVLHVTGASNSFLGITLVGDRLIAVSSTGETTVINNVESYTYQGATSGSTSAVFDFQGPYSAVEAVRLWHVGSGSLKRTVLTVYAHTKVTNIELDLNNRVAQPSTPIVTLNNGSRVSGLHVHHFELPDSVANTGGALSTGDALFAVQTRSILEDFLVENVEIQVGSATVNGCLFGSVTSSNAGAVIRSGSVILTATIASRTGQRVIFNNMTENMLVEDVRIDSTNGEWSGVARWGEDNITLRRIVADLDATWFAGAWTVGGNTAEGCFIFIDDNASYGSILECHMTGSDSSATGAMVYLNGSSGIVGFQIRGNRVLHGSTVESLVINGTTTHTVVEGNFCSSILLATNWTLSAFSGNVFGTGTSVFTTCTLKPLVVTDANVITVV